MESINKIANGYFICFNFMLNTKKLIVMKNFYLLILLISISFHIAGQEWQWVKQIRCNTNTSAKGFQDMTIDNDGNLYIAGTFKETVTFFNDTIIYGQPDFDGFVVKYAPPDFLWIFEIEGGGDDECEAITTDMNKSFCLTGYFQMNGIFGTDTLISSGGSDIFVAKYSLDGEIEWVRQAGGQGYDKGANITLDINENILIAGFFTGEAAFGDTTITSDGYRDIFIAMYDKSGNFQWVTQISTTNTNMSWLPKEITVSPFGDIYFVGSFKDTVDFNDTILISAGNADIFIAKYNPSGQLLWAMQEGGTDGEYINDIVTDESGNFYIAGHFFSQQANFSGQFISSAGDCDIYFAKYNENGQIQWIKSAGGLGWDKGLDILYRDNYIILTGDYEDEANFGDTILVTQGLGSNGDLFIARYDTDGNMDWIQTAGHGNYLPSFTAGNNMASLNSQAIYVAGYFFYDSYFGDFHLVCPAGFLDNFLSEISDPLVGIRDLSGNQEKIVSLFPNPTSGIFTIRFNRQISREVTINVYNCLGQIKHAAVCCNPDTNTKFEMNLSGLSSGTYFVRIHGNNITYNGKILKR